MELVCFEKRTATADVLKGLDLKGLRPGIPSELDEYLDQSGIPRRACAYHGKPMPQGVPGYPIIALGAIYWGHTVLGQTYRYFDSRQYCWWKHGVVGNHGWEWDHELLPFQAVWPEHCHFLAVPKSIPYPPRSGAGESRP